MLPIVSFYAGILAPLFILLSMRVIRSRRGARAAIGDGGDLELLRRIRVQANFAEYVPFALLLIALAEGLGTSPLLLHPLGAVLVVGRGLHAWGVSRTPERFVFRVAGMASTFTVIGVAVACCLVGSIGHLFG